MEDKAKRLVAHLKAKGLTITAAESLTGGRIAAAITAVPGSSAVFPGGIVSYCDEVKHRVLGVPQAILETYGAVSEPAACAMARGAAEIMRTDMALSATGLAGPDGDGGDHPVGTVYLGLYVPGQILCKRHIFRGTRIEIQAQAVEKALELALAQLA